MKKNVGKVDALVRYLLAIVFLVVALLTQIWWFLIGTVVLAATGLVGRCGLYSLFGINTCKVDYTDVEPQEEEE